MPKGFGSALTYNLDSHWGMELDFGHNWNNGNYNTTISGGPRFMWRTEGLNFFLHGLVAYNRLSVTNGRIPRIGRSDPRRWHGPSDHQDDSRFGVIRS